MKRAILFAIALAVMAVSASASAQPKAEEEPAADPAAGAKKDATKKKKKAKAKKAKKGKKGKKGDDAAKADDATPAAAKAGDKADKGKAGDKADKGKAGDKADKGEPAAPAEPEEEPMVLSTDPNAPTGSEENPDGPSGSIFGNEPVVETTAPPEPVSTEYPIEEVLRPLTLPRYMAEIGLDYPVAVDPFAAGGLLRGQFGITDEAQLGVAYGIGTVTSDNYEVGKAAAIDFTYKIQNWVAGQLTLPMMFDPFAIGATVAVPIKFTFFDALSLVLGEELVSFKLYKFFPVVENAVLTEALAAQDDTNTELPDATLRLGLRVIYQLDPKIALDLRGRQIQVFPDEDTTTRNQFNFDGGVMYSLSNKFDLGVRLGWADMAEIDTFGGSLLAQLRI